MASGTIRGRNVTLIFLLAVVGGRSFEEGRWCTANGERMGFAQHPSLIGNDLRIGVGSGIARIWEKGQQRLDGREAVKLGSAQELRDSFSTARRQKLVIDTSLDPRQRYATGETCFTACRDGQPLQIVNTAIAAQSVEMQKSSSSKSARHSAPTQQPARNVRETPYGFDSLRAADLSMSSIHQH
eukprot:2099502-Rhodomonas_salina.1